MADTRNLRVDCKIDRNFCYLFPGEERCAGMENMELTTTVKIKKKVCCFFIDKIVGKFSFVSEFN